MNSKKTPLFSVTCTTCGARIIFYNEARLGEIISCPKCESMVMVEKPKDTETCTENSAETSTESEKKTEFTKVDTPLGSRNVIPPPVPKMNSRAENTEEIGGNLEVARDSQDGVFQFEEKTETTLNIRLLICGTIGIAGCVVGLGLALMLFLGEGAKKDNPKPALELPEKIEINENKESKEVAKDEKNVEVVENGDNAENDEERTQKDGVEAKSIETIANAENAENAEGLELWQSDLGKKLAGDLTDTEDVFKTPEETSETDKNHEDTANRNDKEEVGDVGGAGDSEDKEERGGEEGASESVVGDMQAEDPDRLQFNRKKRSRTYSGEDPILDFDVSTQETVTKPSENAENTQEDKSGENEENSLTVKTPGDENVTEKATQPKLGAFRITAPSVEYFPATWVEKLAVPLEAVNIQGRPVNELVTFASKMAGESIRADWKQMELLGVSMDTPVTITLDNTTVRETLETGLYSVGLGVIPAGSLLRVAGWEATAITRTATEKGEKLDKITIELEDLVATNATESSGKSGINEIANMIQTFVHPALWEKWGGPGKISVNAMKKRITVQQFPSVVREVALFCDKIRHARNMEMKNLPTRANDQRMSLQDGTEIINSEIISRYTLSEKVRRMPVTCDLSDGSTLRNTLTEIMHCAEATLIIDELAIACVPINMVIRDADVPDFEGKKRVLPESILDLPCVYRFEGIAMEEAVTDVLKSLPLFCYPLSENTFFLTTFDEAQRKMLIDFFPVGDIVRSPEMAGTVQNGICETIFPKTWAQNGGAGAIYFDVPSRSFIVRQNPYIVYNIELFLKRYREQQSPEDVMKSKENN